jgi:hypothetical protein
MCRGYNDFSFIMTDAGENSTALKCSFMAKVCSFFFMGGAGIGYCARKINREAWESLGKIAQRYANKKGLS